MNYRKLNHELVKHHQLLRIHLLQITCDFKIAKAGSYLQFEQAVNDSFDAIFKIVFSSVDEQHFKNYRLLSISLFHIIKWIDKQFSGTVGAKANLNAAKINLEQFDFESCVYSESFLLEINDFISSVRGLTYVKDVEDTIKKFSQISFPAYITVEYDPYEHARNNDLLSNDETSEVSNPIIVSVEFSINNEPWANPQVLRPSEVYEIMGRITVNKWPHEYTKLKLYPFSVQSNALYELYLPDITKGETSNISGHVVFKYPQHSFDQSMVVKLVASFTNDEGKNFLPTIIGYDQLIAKVLDPNAHYFLSGFKNMNKAIIDIAVKIERELPQVDKEEKEDFLRLLSGILNYQGFCLQHGTYKNQSNVTENLFRDNLIQHLVGISYLGEDIVKEAHYAGGRVEIIYKGISAELKVERSLSDRQKIIDKYSRQAVTYSSSNTKSLSILVILEVIEKKKPVAAPQNNIYFENSILHGFEGRTPPFPSKLAVVIIEGNTKKPSDYSR